MGFYLRKSFKLGPVRLNLSKSGLGASFGIKGFRYGINAQGKEYIHAGRYGLYYRKQKRKNNLYDTEEFTDKPVNNYNSPLNTVRKAVWAAVIYFLFFSFLIKITPDNTGLELLFKFLLYLYPSFQAIINKTEVANSIIMNIITGWTIVGWLYAFAWGIPKKYNIKNPATEEEKIVIDKAKNVLNILKGDYPFLKLLPDEALDALSPYLEKDFYKLTDNEIRLLAEQNDLIKILEEKYKKELPSLRRSQAKSKGYKFGRTKATARDNRLRCEGLLRDKIFWEYFATKFDKPKVNKNNEDI